MPPPLPAPPSPAEENAAEADAPEDEDEEDEDDDEEEEEEDATDDDDDENDDSSSRAPPPRSRAPRLMVEGVWSGTARAVLMAPLGKLSVQWYVTVAPGARPEEGARRRFGSSAWGTSGSFSTGAAAAAMP